MMADIVAFSKHEGIMILQSVGIETHIIDDLDLLKQEMIKKAETDAKIIIYTAEAESFISTVLEKYDDKLYPIFLKLPMGKDHEDTLLELKVMIEKSIGISII